MGDERGQALIETLLVGLVLIVPLVWVLSALADLHSGALAATAAAREAGFEAARSGSLTTAQASADAAADQAFADQGLSPERAEVRLSASRLERGGVVEVEVAYPVAVMRIPLLEAASQPVVWINARHVARVDPYRSRP